MRVAICEAISNNFPGIIDVIRAAGGAFFERTKIVHTFTFPPPEGAVDITRTRADANNLSGIINAVSDTIVASFKCAKVAYTAVFCPEESMRCVVCVSNFSHYLPGVVNVVGKAAHSTQRADILHGAE